MSGPYKCDFKSKLKPGVLLVIVSLIARMCVVYVLQTRQQEYPLGTFAKKVARYHHRVHSEEKNASLGRFKQEHFTYGEVIHGTERVILYNSAPKCGSRTFGSTSKRLFRNRSIPMNIYTLRKDKQIQKLNELRRLVEKVKAPAFCQGHGFFEPFDQRPRPVYINFVRDPVSRMVSAFYFRRNGDLSGLIGEQHLNRSLEDCLSGRYCQFVKKNIYVGIFCGFDERCGNLTWALEQAKSNIDKYYTYIGITEDYEASLRILEHLLPDIYNGVTELYRSLLNDTNSMPTKSKTINKEPLSQRANDTATELFAIDYQLYNYIYDRHRALKVRFGIN